MKHICSILFTAILCFCNCYPAAAQTQVPDTIQTLDTVLIVSGRLYDFSGGQTTITFDTLTTQQYSGRSVADMIATQTTLNIKTYGPGMLSNISFRGNAPQHTGVFWNGISINASNIGMTDFSLLPVNFFDKIEYRYGGSSALFGSGAIGGSVHLWSEAAFSKMFKTQLQLQYGSFSEYAGNLKVQWANQNVYSSTSVVYTDALNNFGYINTAAFGSPVQKLENAALNNKGLLQDFSLKINNRNTLSISGWVQQNNREIPGTMTTAVSQAKQNDNIIRIYTGWDRITDNTGIYLKTAVTTESERYTDPLLQLDSRIKINNYIFESGFSKKIRKNIKLDFNIHNTLSVADVASYNAIKSMNRTAFVLSYNHNILPLGIKTQANIRYEIINPYKAPVSPAIGAEARIWHFLYGKMNVSKNFRTPTMNDLYWQPGGNTNLKAEESLNEEAGFVFKPKKGAFKNTEISATGFHSVIENCIQWVPTAYTYWAPQNLKTVRTQGMEFQGRTTFKLSKWLFALNGGYTYTDASNIKSASAFDESVNKQLIYLPYEKAFINMTTVFNGFSFNYNHQFTGFRFVNASNTEFMPAYNMGSFSLTYALPFNTVTLEGRFTADNIWNASYQAIQWRPMPGRAFRTSISIKFNK